MNEQWLSAASAWKYLIQTLTMLAVDAREQTTWLDKYRLETDDLALDFENARGAIVILAEAGRIDVAMESRLAHIDATLDAMSGPEHASRWTYEALAADAGWLNVRQLAREALRELAGTWQQPLPTMTTYGSCRWHLAALDSFLFTAAQITGGRALPDNYLARAFVGE